MTWTNSPLRDVIVYAYGIRADQLSAPDWLGSARYDISANVPLGSTLEQARQMLKNLLIERFRMAVHHETKYFPAYDLVIYKGKPKLTTSTAEHVAAHASTETSPTIPDKPRLAGRGYGGVWSIRGEAAPISALASWLGGFGPQLGGRVVDKTGITGYFDFTLEYSRSLDSQSDTAPYVVDAIQEQLGLDLQESKLALDLLVVDRLEKKPSPN